MKSNRIELNHLGRYLNGVAENGYRVQSHHILGRLVNVQDAVFEDEPVPLPRAPDAPRQVAAHLRPSVVGRLVEPLRYVAALFAHVQAARLRFEAGGLSGRMGQQRVGSGTLRLSVGGSESVVDVVHRRQMAEVGRPTVVEGR